MIDVSGVPNKTIVDQISRVCACAPKLTRIFVSEEHKGGRRDYPLIPDCALEFSAALRKNRWPGLYAFQFMPASDRECHVIKALLEHPVRTLKNLHGIYPPSAAASREIIRRHPDLKHFYAYGPLGHKLTRIPDSSEQGDHVLHAAETIAMVHANDLCFRRITFGHLRKLCLGGDRGRVSVSSIDVVLSACPALEHLILREHTCVLDWKLQATYKAHALTTIAITQVPLTAASVVNLLFGLPNLKNLRLALFDQHELPDLRDLARRLSRARRRKGRTLQLQRLDLHSNEINMLVLVQLLRQLPSVTCGWFARLHDEDFDGDEDYLRPEFLAMLRQMGRTFVWSEDFDWFSAL